jgi:hypothetical protein
MAKRTPAAGPRTTPPQPAPTHPLALPDVGQPASTRTAVWRQQFLRDLRTLSLDESLHRLLARATRAEPWHFCDPAGRPMDFARWARAVRDEGWQMAGLGKVRRRRLLEALAGWSEEKVTEQEHTMEIVSTEPDGRHLVRLDSDELAILLDGLAQAPAVPKPGSFLQQLHALHLSESTYNAVARALRRQPDRFLDEQGRPLSFEAWVKAVAAGQWKANGVGPGRLREIVEAVGVHREPV